MSTKDFQYYFVSPMVVDKPLFEILDDEENRPIDWFLDFCIQTLQALDHAHKNGIIHGDLNSHNLVIDENDGERAVRIFNFSLAKSIYEGSHKGDDDGATAGLSMGDPACMSSEQRLGDIENITMASDIYSVGVTIHRFLIGDIPKEVGHRRRN